MMAIAPKPLGTTLARLFFFPQERRRLNLCWGNYTSNRMLFESVLQPYENREMKILMVTPMPPQPQAPGAIPLVLHAELAGLIAAPSNNPGNDRRTGAR